MKKIALAVGLSCLSAMAAASEINFDSGLMNRQVIYDGYGGLDWDKFAAFKPNASSGPGYVSGTMSGSFVAYNHGGAAATISSAGSFSLVSAYLTAGWRNGLQLTVTGYLGEALVNSATYTLGTSSASFINFGLGNVDRVVFASSGGSGTGGPSFVMDNLTVGPALAAVTPVPEPQSYAMFLAGLGLIGGVARRRLSRR